MKTLAACLMIGACAIAGTDRGIPTLTVKSEACVDAGEDPSCIFLECDHLWQWKNGDTVLAEMWCPPGYQGWGYIDIHLGGSSLEVHCCPEGTIGYATYYFFPDYVTIFDTTLDCS